MCGEERAWKATPTEKTTQDRMSPIRRPTMSAMGAEANAPKTVPTERMETTRDVLDVEIEQVPPLPGLLPNVHSLEGCEGRMEKKDVRAHQSFMARIPEMVPVS